MSWHDEDLTVRRRGRWWHYYDGSGREVRRLPVLTGAATITASAAGGNANTGGAWVGGVQPTSADDVVIDGTSAGITIPSGTTLACRSINASGGKLTFAATTSVLNIGDSAGGAVTFSNTSTVTLTGIGTINFLATTASTTYLLTSGGRTLPNVTVNTGTSTTIQLADALTSTGAVTLTQGILDLNSKTGMTWASFSASNSNVRTFTQGSATYTLTGAGTSWATSTTTSMTFTANTATVTLSGGGATFQCGSNTTLSGLSVVLSGSGTATISGQNTFLNVTRTGTAAKTDALTLQNNITVTGTLTLNSNSSVNRLVVQSNVLGTAHTITAAALVCTGVIDFQDTTGAGGATWTTAASGATYFGDAGHNSGITFTTSANQTWSGTSGGNWSTNAWTSRVPLPQDTAIISSAFIASQVVTVDMPRVGAVDFTGSSVNTSLQWNTSIVANVFGSVTLVSGMTYGGPGTFQFEGAGSFTFTSNGATCSGGGSQTFNAPASTWTLGDNFSANSLNGKAGTLTANGTVTCLTMAVSGATVNMGTGQWSITQTTAATVWNYTAGTVNAQTSTIAVTTASANTRTFAGGGHIYNNLTYTVASSAGVLALTGANTFDAVHVGAGRTLTLPHGVQTTINTTWDIQGTVGSPTTVNSDSPGVQANLHFAFGTPPQSPYVAAVDINVV